MAYKCIVVRLLSIVLAMSAAPAFAVPAVQVADLETRALNLAGLDDSPMLAIDGAVYFRGRDAAHGWELWRSEGTAETTRLVRDICPGPCDSSPASLAELAGEVYFFAQDGATGRELWRSDGTAAGTRLVRDIFPGETDSEPYIFQERGFVRLGDRLYFGAQDEASGNELWTTDGSRTGTRRAVDLCPGPCSAEIASLSVIGDEIFFFANDGVSGTEPRRSNGTAEGTVLLGDLCDGRCGARGVFFAHQERAYVWSASLGQAGTCWSLWRPAADGSAFTLCSGLGALPPKTVELNGLLYFGWDGSLQRLDPVAPSLAEVVKLKSTPREVVRLGSHLFFAAGSAEAGEEIWKSNGTAKGTAVLKDTEPGVASGNPSQLTPAGRRLFFTTSDFPVEEPALPLTRKLWVTDGSPKGTVEIRPLAADGTPFWFRSLTVAGDQLFFSADRSDIGRELWTTDGTAGGTSLVRDLYADPGSSNPGALAALGSTLVFGATRSVGSSFEESIWRSDGTSGGTSMVLPFTRPTGVSAVVGGTLMLGADFRLFRTDATVSGTVEIPDTLPFEMQAVGNRVFLSAYGRLHGEVAAGDELWQSDGTTEGTRLVKDIVPGIPDGAPFPNSSSPRGLTPWGAGVLFSASDFEHGNELWVSDGSAEGTALVKDICPGHCPSDLAELTLFGGRAFFAASDPSSGRELWVTDGTGTGTSRVADLVPGSKSSSPRDLIVFAGRLLFFADDAQGDEHLWSSDGTAAGTRPLAGPGRLLAKHQPTVAGDRLFFTAWTDPLGAELWTTDGTGAGTRLVADLLPGPAGSYPHELTPVGDRLLFVADDGVAGHELWVTNGAASGTFRLPEIAPGQTSSAPAEITRAGGRLYFAATSPDGRELWALDAASLEAAPCAPGPSRLCLADGRFEVTVRWRDQHNGGREGTGQAVPESNDSGFFWFFAPENLELAVKVLDAGAVNGRLWVFFGALSDVEYWVTVTDRESGTAQTYHNPPGTFCGQADTSTFPAAVAVTPRDFALLNASALELPPPREKDSCVSGPESLCLLGGRFRVAARFRDPRTGAQTAATAAPRTDNTGSFSFFDPANVELLVKLLDGQPVNGRLWLFYGALSDVEYWIDVTDTATGKVKSYHNPPGTYCGQADTRAF